MLQWVGENGYDPQELRQRYDVYFSGARIARACCGAMPGEMKRQADHPGFSFHYSPLTLDGVLPVEFIRTLTEYKLPLVVIRRLASIYVQPEYKGDWVFDLWRL